MEGNGRVRRFSSPQAFPKEAAEDTSSQTGAKEAAQRLCNFHDVFSCSAGAVAPEQSSARKRSHSCPFVFL